MWQSRSGFNYGHESRRTNAHDVPFSTAVEINKLLYVIISTGLCINMCNVIRLHESSSRRCIPRRIIRS